MANLPSNLTKTDIKWFITSLNDILKKEVQSEEDIKFLEYLKELTGQEDINQVLAALTDWFIAPDVEQPSQTTPENLEELVEASEKRKAQEAKSKATARAETRQFIKTQKQIYLNLPEKLNPPQITPEEETELNDLIQNKIKKNPTLYADTLAKEIVKQNTKPGMTKDQIKTLMANAKLVTINYTDKLLGLESKEEILGNAVKIAWAQNPIHVAASLANPDNPLIGEKIAGVAQITALTLENDYLIARNLLFDRANSRVLRLLYPGANEIILFGASNEANEKTVISVDREAFTNQGIKLEQTSDQIFELVKNKAWGPIKDKSWKVLDRTLSNTPWYSKIKSLVPDFLRPHIPVFAVGETVQPGLSLLWNSQGIKLLATDLPTLLSSSFGESVLLTPTFNFQFGSLAVSRTLFTTAEGLTGQALGINIGNFGVTLIRGGEKGLQILINLGAKAAAPVVTGAAAGGGTAAVAAGGLSGWLAGIMATLGAWGTPILMAIFAAVGWLAGKLLSGIVNWARKHQDDLKIIGAIILGAGVLLRSLPLMVMGGLIFVPLAIGGGISMAGVGAGLFLFFRRLGKSMAITIGVPAIVTIIAFPILVAIILFIINSGAYLVPPLVSPITGIVESAYLKVDKIAVPAGPFENSDLPLTIRYTIKITAKKSTITNIRVENTYTISQTPLIAAPPQIDLPDMPEAIPPTAPYSFSYEVVYDQNFKDSIVADNFKIIADTPGSKDNVAVGVATIVIGTPPEDCPSGWPVLTDQGQKYFVMQGPHAACTHGGSYPDREAIDVQVYPPDRSIAASDLVIATHKGNIVSIGMDGWGGLYVDILGSCGGQSFRSRHVHFSAFSSGLSRGSLVNKGIVLGIMGKTGSAYKPHDHYEFREAQRGGSDASGNPPVKMIPPFVPKRVPNRCCGDCNVFIP